METKLLTALGDTKEEELYIFTLLSITMNKDNRNFKRKIIHKYATQYNFILNNYLGMYESSYYNL